MKNSSNALWIYSPPSIGGTTPQFVQNRQGSSRATLIRAGERSQKEQIRIKWPTDLTLGGLLSYKYIQECNENRLLPAHHLKSKPMINENFRKAKIHTRQFKQGKEKLSSKQHEDTFSFINLTRQSIQLQVARS